MLSPALFLSRQQLVLMSLCVVVFLCQCSGGKQVKEDAKGVSPKAGEVVEKGCIRGRVVNEDGKGFSGVLVATIPPTTQEVTNSQGFFEICQRSVIKDKETGETAKEAIPPASYALQLKKEGFHARPLKFDYQGGEVRLQKLLMVEKTRPLPSVVQTTVEEDKRTAGTGSKPPMSE